MSAWIKCLRLPVCILASFLTITSFVLAKISISWIAVLSVYFIASATMLQNDWRDRFHDVRKGKKLASEHKKAFLALLIVVWMISAGLIAFTIVDNATLGIVLTIVAIVGLVYSETRKIPLVPIVIVSFVSAGPALLPLTNGANSEKLLPLFFSTTLVIFAREITKDLDDKKIDSGYKWTIPLALTERHSRILSAIAIIVGFLIIVKVSLIIFPVTIFAVITGILLVRGAKLSIIRKYLDIEMAFVIFIIIIFR